MIVTPDSYAAPWPGDEAMAVPARPLPQSIIASIKGYRYFLPRMNFRSRVRSKILQSEKPIVEACHARQRINR